MPRPKGSKNKKTIAASAASTSVLDLTAIEEMIGKIESEIDTLGETIKAKKAELKELGKQKLAAEKRAAERKAEEDKSKLLDAVEKSGKSIEEILELIKN